MAKTLLKADLHRLSTNELLQLFATLEAPEIQEMQGDYRASLLKQPNLLAKVFGWMAVANPIRSWQSKAFRPVDGETGRGYNTFLQGGKVVQHYPYQRHPPERFLHRRSKLLRVNLNTAEATKAVIIT